MNKFSCYKLRKEANSVSFEQYIAFESMLTERLEGLP